MASKQYKYISYEESIKGKYTESDMKKLYNNKVNKKEYSTFKNWLVDMLKSGVFEKL